MQEQKTSNNGRNQQMKIPGRFVSGRSIESKVLIRLLQEYDGCVVYIRNRMGREGFDTKTASDLIARCNEIEEKFKELIKDMKDFVKESESKRKEKEKKVTVEEDI
mgnify:CR=1 FL=1